VNVIEIKQLTKDSGNKKGVFDLDISVKKGDVIGFLGPNGAGKTTTMKPLIREKFLYQGQRTLYGRPYS